MTHGGGTTADGPSIFEEGEGNSGRVIQIAVVAAMGGLLFGYDSAVINGATKAIEGRFDIHGYTLGFAVASALLGAAAGAMTAGRIADRIGRLRVMQIAAVLFFLSAVGCAFATQTWMLILFRVIGGVGVGVASVIAPAYIAEVSPARIRGRLGSLQQLAIVLGIFLSLLIDWLLASLAGGASNDLWLGMEAWRWMFLVMAIPAVVYGVASTLIPESPRYLVSRHRIPEARRVLTMLLGEKNLDLTVHRIEESLAGEEKHSWRDLMKPGGGVYPIVWVGLLLSIFQQAVGINVIFYYSNMLWQAVGFEESQSNQISVFTSIVNVVVTIVAILLVDRIGRRPLLLIGSIGMTVSLATMALCFSTAEMIDGKPSLTGAVGVLALVAANLFVIFFGVSWGPVVWVLLGEMFPNRIRAAALSLAAAAQWAANWAITVTFPKMEGNLTLAYGLYATFALLSLFFVYRFVPETKGKTLEDMDGNLPAR
ncbi:putative sugar transporter [Tsukamurella pulmonis]|uniref:MFS transporter, sugar porter (SP) family n=1 Tax=Tsukamurella pulmonis TaxID=47312 RepID=A0A1H1F0Y7_9ACTN|nr:sugar porter family MFS transporter [Tsukamurella pulmonis]KXO91721.1 MFS transporter [Tsukamurella pulmonis]KXP09377.1 MFS transporter [Tsukamurella pulmonis]RDH09236.1 MFS transporter [Tsukamurella pulmonis]SDQ94622.1 MFS transporter, sugar porter (SP) family [Tsukamurella pulmonis]SUP20243.1 D-xylose transporter [Tsukamurella pulmonis]